MSRLHSTTAKQRWLAVENLSLFTTAPNGAMDCTAVVAKTLAPREGSETSEMSSREKKSELKNIHW